MKHARGFTLIELAIVLVIVTILIGGLAVPLSAQIQARRIGETKKTLEEAREAIFGYAMTHPTGAAGNLYLPCPDRDGDGHEDRSGTECMVFEGLLPWIDLGTAPQDAWGNRLRYAVIKDLAANDPVDTAKGISVVPPTNSLVSPSPLVICTTHTCTTASPDVANGVAFVLISHGPSGWGARSVNGTTLAGPSGPDETENLDSDQIYVSRTPTQSSAASGEFDDLLTWTAFSQLVAKVCPTGSDCNPLPAP
jgi:prepilin-type N-terminal cleavage/methylation domain-containing protein